MQACIGCTPDAQSTSLDWESDESGQQVETHSHRSSDECVGHLRAHVIDMVAGRRHRRHDTRVADGRTMVAEHPAAQEYISVFNIYLKFKNLTQNLMA